MEISWRRIKENSDKIIEEFDRLYTYERNYRECENLIKDIFGLYSSKYNIELDESDDFDHIFHQLLSGIEEVTKQYTPIDLQEQNRSMKVDALFQSMSEEILKTTEIRGRLKEIDPSNFEVKKALETGIEESRQRQSETNEALESIRGIFGEIFGTSIPNLKNITESEVSDIGNFNKILTKLLEIDSLQNAMATMTPGVDDVSINANQTRISELTTDIDELKDRIGRTNLVDNKRLGSIGVNDINASIAEVVALRDELDLISIIDFTRLQANLSVAYNKYPYILAISSMDFSKMNPNTEEGRTAIREAYGALEESYRALEMDYKIYGKEIQAFESQIKQIEEENKILEVETPTVEDVSNEITDLMKTNIDAEISYYEDMVISQMYGNKEYKERYNKYLAIFKNHILLGNRRKSFVLRNEDGSPIFEEDGVTEKIGKFATVDYDGITQELQDSGMRITAYELLKFLQLEDYRDKIERDSKVAAGDKLALTEYKSYELVKNAKTPEEKAEALKALKTETTQDQLYLSTYHYATNDYAFNREHHATAGKIGETYIPLEEHEKGEGFGKALQVSAHNLYAYTRWQNPFKADSFLGGVGRMVLNAGNIVTFFPRVITRATGNIISKVAYNKEVDPNPYNGRRDARRGARVDYYKENGDNAFVARTKGWLDEFGGKRKKNTEKAIIDRQVAEIKKGLEELYIDGTYEQTFSKIQEQKDIIKRNREIRTRDARIIASTWQTQGDIIKDYELADEDVLRARTIQRMALEYSDINSGYVSNAGSRTLDDDPLRNIQFTNGKESDKIELEGKKEIKGVAHNSSDLENVKLSRKKGGVISADPIGRAIRSREIKNTLTRWYAIETAALLKGQSALIKWGSSKMQPTNSPDVPDATNNPDEVPQKSGELQDTGLENGGHYEYPGTTHEGVVGTREVDTARNIKMGDLEYQDKAYYEHTASPEFKSVDWIEAPTASNTQAMSLDYIVPDNLSASDYQILEQYGLKAGDRISYSVADEATRNLCKATGKHYATTYIDGMFEFTDDTNIADAINQYFPQNVSQPLEVILKSENYAGKAGVDFLTDSFATSHGISSVMEKMNTWGTGWGIESVNSDALESAKKVIEIIGEVPDDPVWVADNIEEPILKWVENSEIVSTPEEAVVVKSGLNRLANGLINGFQNGLEAVGYGTEIHDLVRNSKIHKEPNREIYRGEDR